MLSAKARIGYVDSIHRSMAYAARYGNQSLEVLERKTVRYIRRFNRSLSDIVKEENKPRED